MHLALVLAAGKTLWDPTIIGILAPVSGVFLFCGSVYLLLSTNLGARLGFLIAATALSGFMVLLSTLWLTTSTPLESPKGRTAAWNVVEIDKSFADSKIPTIRTAVQDGTQLTPQNPVATTVRSFLDTAFVKVNPAFGVKAPLQPFAQFAVGADYLTNTPDQGLNAYEVGGGNHLYFWHNPEYAALIYCVALVQTVPFGQPPPTPVCDPAQPKKVVVLIHDYGSIRLPPICYLGGSIILFIISMLGLHWFETDERERERARQAAAQSPVPKP
jgi:hypothetical protein